MQDYDFTGTKKSIFDSAVRLFMLSGYDSVSLRDIAHDVGIRQSTIYNHFSSKQELLDTIYGFYLYYFRKTRPSSEEMELRLQSDDLLDIMGLISYDFEGDVQQKMNDITNIIFQRLAIDAKAREIAKGLILTEGVEYVETLFNKAVELGKVAPIDTHALAVFINGVRLFTLYNWLVDPSPENTQRTREDEQSLYKLAAEFLANRSPEHQAEQK